MSLSDTQLTIYQGQAGFLQLQPEWSALAQCHATHFLHFPAWYDARLQAVVSSNQLVFCALRQANELIGVIPFERITIKKGPISISALSLGYANEMGLCDCLMPEAQGVSLNLVQRSLRQAGVKFRFLKFDCMSDGSMAADWLRSFRLPSKTSHVTKYLDLSGGREAFYSGYSAKFNRNMRRKLKKTAELGSLQIERFRNQEALSAFDEFLRLEDSGWKGREGTSILKQPDKLKYYQILTQGMSDDGVLSVNLLKIDDRYIAAQVGVLVNNTLNLLKIAYDESYSEISPGYLLIDGLVAEKDHPDFVEKISFVTGVDWIDRWKPQTHAVRVAYTTQYPLLDNLLGRVLERTQQKKEQAAGQKLQPTTT